MLCSDTFLFLASSILCRILFEVEEVTCLADMPLDMYQYENSLLSSWLYL